MCDCQESKPFYKNLSFQVCERGFILRDTGREYEIGTGRIFAFEQIEDVAAWLVEQYSERLTEPMAFMYAWSGQE